VGLANIDLIEREGLVERAAVMGKKLLAGLETLRSFRIVGDVRGLGMMAAVELTEEANGLGAKIISEAMERGLITRQRGAGARGGMASNDTIMLAPPLMTPEATLDRIVQILADSLTAVPERRAAHAGPGRGAGTPRIGLGEHGTAHSALHIAFYRSGEVMIGRAATVTVATRGMTSFVP
jgi:hypothetical protein